LARALVANPAVVLMDEPLSSLDPELNLHLRREILRLHAELSFTLVYVTHSREEAADIGSRVIAMGHGRIDA
jgi:ABC-type sugar transport system ATPase subunit